MRTIKLFEEFTKGAHNYEEITPQEFLSLSESEIGWMVWKYPAHQPRAWGQWESKQPDDFRMVWKGMLDADLDHGIAEDDSVPMGKYLRNKKNVTVLNALVDLFNRKYPGVDYV